VAGLEQQSHKPTLNWQKDLTRELLNIHVSLVRTRFRRVDPSYASPNHALDERQGVQSGIKITSKTNPRETTCIKGSWHWRCDNSSYRASNQCASCTPSLHPVASQSPVQDDNTLVSTLEEMMFNNTHCSMHYSSAISTPSRRGGRLLGVRRCMRFAAKIGIGGERRSHNDVSVGSKLSIQQACCHGSK